MMAEQSTAVQRTQKPNAPKMVKFETLADSINSLFSDITRRAYQIFENNGHQPGHDLEDWVKAERELLRPVNLEIGETGEALQVRAEVPGFSEKELQISVEPRRLTITGKHETSKEEKKGKTIYSESSATDILRVVSLPVEVDAAKASATLKDGVLNLTIPKVQTVRVQPKAA
jgi:HSP20 family protein